MSEQLLGLRDYFDILRRRRWQLVWPAALAALGCAFVLYTADSVYKATATILVDKEDIRSSVVEQTEETRYIDERIQALERRVLSEESLWRIAQSLELFREVNGEDRRTRVAAQVRSAASTEIIRVDVTNPRSGRPGVATVAFTVSYESESPRTAREVANRLAERFIEESGRDRRQRAAEVSAFLDAETKRLAERLAAQEQELATFKREHAGNLPDQRELNMRLLDQTQEKLDNVKDKIENIDRQLLELKPQLAQTPRSAAVYDEDGDAVRAPATELRYLRSQYLSLLAKYSPGHPDLVRARRGIHSLVGQVDAAEPMAEVVDELSEARSKLADLRERYSELHPDVRRQQKRIADLKGKLGDIQVKPSVQGDEAAPDNPSYIALQSRYDLLEAQLEQERDERDRLRARLQELEARVRASPEVERKYRALTRDYENTLKKYREIRGKQMEAELTEQVERNERGEQFRLVERASTPRSPVRPNRPAIMALALLLAVGGGLGSAATAEYLDPTLYREQQLIALVGAPAIAVIPTIPNNASKRLRNGALVTVGVCVTLTALAVAVWQWLQ